MLCVAALLHIHSLLLSYRHHAFPYRIHAGDFDAVVQDRFHMAGEIAFPSQIIPASTADMDYDYVSAVRAFNPEWLFEYMMKATSWALNNAICQPKPGWPHSHGSQLGSGAKPRLEQDGREQLGQAGGGEDQPAD